ncbi:MAG TPA: DUF244 domain-containing protein, partial [Candidatus Altiarchaeales archaeon]|nr:DUF244 domain-containing protein [Candidatus Altiarchaeales archaeon]
MVEMLNILKERLVFKLVFRAEKPFTLSPVKGYELSENMIIVRKYKIGEREFSIIPSTSLKGAFRRISEYISISIDYENSIVNEIAKVHCENKKNQHPIKGDIKSVLEKIISKYPLIKDQLVKDGILQNNVIEDKNKDRAWSEASALL